MYEVISSKPDTKVAVVGGGVAGSTIALRLAELGIDTTLFEKGDGLVSGPPICHLHAGGNLYREISDQQCLTLLQQFIDTVKVYADCVNWRPTVIALPTWDKKSPENLLPRLNFLRDEYSQLVEKDPTNNVLGAPENYYRSYTREQLEALAKQPIPKSVDSADDWLVPFAKYVDLSKVKFPIILVQEYGLSSFRFAAACQLSMERLASCTLKLNHQIKSIEKTSGEQQAWSITVTDGDGITSTKEFDYVVNAAGFRTGELDDMLGIKRDRLVEFKAAYIAKWNNWQAPLANWPEIIFHGERGTPQGMAQLTPYAGGYFQIHGMSESITLFKDGLVASNDESAQPKLAEHHLEKIDCRWQQQDINTRTSAAIGHIAQFLPQFTMAEIGGKPLYGAQQIPGSDPSLRAAGVSFYGEGYARAEIVKASSALAASDAILQDLAKLGLVARLGDSKYLTEHYFPVTSSHSCSKEVTAVAENIALKRGYPIELAEQIQAGDHSISNQTHTMASESVQEYSLIAST